MATDRPSILEMWPVAILAGVGMVLLVFALLPQATCTLSKLQVAESESRNNLKQFGLALHNYAADRNGSLPPGTLVDAQSATLHGWEALLLPYVDQAPLHARIDFAQPWDTPENLALFRTPLRTFQDLRYAMQIDADGLPVSHYAANELVLKPGRTMRFDEITDGLSNTIVAGTAAENPRGWGTPYNLRDPRIGLNTGPDSFGCPNGRPIILFGDGSVRMVNEKIASKAFGALGTPAGGEKVDPLP